MEEDYKKEARRRAKEARRSLLSIQSKARNLGMTKGGYLTFRAGRNLETFVNGAAFNISVAILILMSVGLIFAEFLMQASILKEKVIALNDHLTWIFVVELSLRFLVAPNKRMFFRNFWLDILAVLPALRIFRTMRVLRLARLLRLSRAAIILLRQSGWLSARLERFFGSFGVLLLTAAMLIVCGTLMLLTLEGLDVSSVADTAYNSPLSQFLEKVWITAFLFISGEVVAPLPVTAEGRIVALLISISGMVVFAILVGTISATMTEYFKTRVDVKDLSIGDLSEHTIICGWDRMGSMILSELESVDDIWLNGVVIVAETEEDILSELTIRNPRRLFHIREDFTKMDVLEGVGAKQARAAIVLADKGQNLKDQDRDARTVLAALTLEKLNPSIFTCAELLDEVNATHLKIAGVEEIISRTSLTAGLFASTLVNRGISSLISDFLTHQQGTYLKKINLPERYVGISFFDVFKEFKRDYDATILAVEWKEPGTKSEHHINPPQERKMESEDVLILMTNVGSKLMGAVSKA